MTVDEQIEKWRPRLRVGQHAVFAGFNPPNNHEWEIHQVWPGHIDVVGLTHRENGNPTYLAAGQRAEGGWPVTDDDTEAAMLSLARRMAKSPTPNTRPGSIAFVMPGSRRSRSTGSMRRGPCSPSRTPRASWWRAFPPASFRPGTKA